MKKYRNKLFYVFFSLMGLLLASSSAFAGNRYWVGTTNSNFSDTSNGTTNWSLTSGGSPGASVPGSGDVAIFDSGGDVDCTIDSSVAVAAFTMDASYTKIVTQNADLTIYSSLTQDGGTFTANSGTISFTGGNYISIDVNSSITFNNLTISKCCGYSTTIGSGDTINVNGTFSAVGPYNAINGGTIALNNGGSFSGGHSSAGSTVLNVVSGTLTMDTTGGDLSVPKIVLNGGNLAFSGSGATTITYLTVSNANSTVTAGSGNIIVSNTFAQSAGTVTLSSGTFTAGTTNLTGGTLDFGTTSSTKALGTLTINGGIIDALNFTGTLTTGGDLNFTTGTFKANNTLGAMTLKSYSNVTVAAGFSFNNGTTNNSNIKMNFILDGGNYDTVDVDTSFDVNNFTISKCCGYSTTIASGDTIVVNGTFSAIGPYNAINTGTIALKNGGSFSSNNSSGGDANIRVDAGTLDFNTTDGALVVPKIIFNGGTGTFTGSNATTFTALTMSHADSTLTAGSGNITVSGALTQSNGTITLSSTGTFSAGSANLTGGTLNYNTSSANITFGSFTIDGATLNAINYTGIMRVNGNLTFTSGTFKANNTVGGMTITAYSDITVGANISFNNGTTTNSNIKMNFSLLGNGYATFDVDTSFDVNSLTINKDNGYSTTIASGDTIIVNGEFSGIGPYNAINTGTIVLKNGGSFSNNDSHAGDATIEVDSGILEFKMAGGAMSLPRIYLNGGNGTITSADSNSYALTLASLTIGNANSTFTGLENHALTVAGVTSVTAGAFNLNGSNYTANGGVTIASGASLKLLGDETATTPTLDAGSTVEYKGTSGPYTIKNWTYSNLLVNSGAANVVFSLSTNTTIGNNLTNASGILNLNGKNLAVTGAFSNADIVRLQGGETCSLSMDTDSGTFEYIGSGNYSSLACGNTYNHLTFNGSGSWIHDNTLDVNGNLTITAGTLNSNGTDITVGANWANTGTYTSDSNTVTFDGTGAQSIVTGGIAQAFNNLTINKASGTATLSTNPIKINGNFIIMSGGTFATGGNNMTLLGNWSNSGTFTHGNATVTLGSGSESQSISGTTTFYNLTKSVTSAATLSFAGGPTQTIEGTLTLNGATGNLLTIANAPVMMDAKLDAQGERILSYLSVSHNNNMSGTTMACWNGCVNGGNNTNWSFSAPTIAWQSASQTNANESGNITVTAELSTTSPLTTTIPFTVTGTATGSGTDYTLVTSSPLTINPGDTTASVTITVTADTLDEDDETIILTMGTPTNATASGITVHTITIADNDAAPTVTLGSNVASMSETGGTATLTATLNTASGRNVTVNLATSGTATSVTDYTLSSTSITIAAGDTTGTATLSAVSDLIDENNETIITDISSVTNGTESGSQQATVTITDDDVAGATITQSGGNTNVTEGNDGAPDTYTVVLTSEPTADVSIAVNSSDGTTGAQTTTDTDTSHQTSRSLTFTSANWNTPQTVTVYAVEDNVDEASVHTATINHSSISSDTFYSGLTINSVTVNITDNDTAAVSVIEMNGGSPDGVTAVSESGATDTYTMVLTTQPTADVTISISPESDHISVSPSTMTFTSSNWNTLQMITVTPLDDFIQSGSASLNITHVASSADSNYNTISIVPVVVTIADIDTVGITISPSITPLTATEGGEGSTITAVLHSKPTADVTLDMSVNSNVTLEHTSLLFSASNWNVPQTIHITALDDSSDEGDLSYVLTVTPSSSDPLYNAIEPSDYTVTIIDNDSSAGSDGSSAGSTSGGTTSGGSSGGGGSSTGGGGDTAGGSPSGEGSSGGGSNSEYLEGRFVGSSEVTHVSIERTSGVVLITPTDTPIYSEETTDDSGAAHTRITTTHGTIDMPGHDVVVTSTNTDNELMMSSSSYENDTGLVAIVDSEASADISLLALSASTTNNSSTALTIGKPKNVTIEGATVLTGIQEGDRFGEYITTGDINGDGVEEYIISSPGAGAYGLAYVYDQYLNQVATIYGSADQPITSLYVSSIFGSAHSDLTFLGNNPSLNPDLRRTRDLTSSDYSALTSTLAQSSTLTGSVDLSQVTADARFSGSYLAIASGDLNGDGDNDIALSTSDGRVLIYFGPISPGVALSSRNADVVVTGDGGEFGRMISIAEVNGDDRADLIVGAPIYGNNQEGAVYVIFGLYYFPETINVTNTSVSNSILRIDGDTAQGQIGEDILTQFSESTNKNNIYTIEGDNTVLRLDITAQTVTQNFQVGGRSSLFGFVGCNLIKDEEVAETNTSPWEILSLMIISTAACFSARRKLNP